MDPLFVPPRGIETAFPLNPSTVVTVFTAAAAPLLFDASAYPFVPSASSKE